MGVQLLFLLLVLPCLHAARLRGATLQPLQDDSSNAVRGSRQSRALGANQALGNQARNTVVTVPRRQPKPSRSPRPPQSPDVPGSPLGPAAGAGLPGAPGLPPSSTPPGVPPPPSPPPPEVPEGPRQQRSPRSPSAPPSETALPPPKPPGTRPTPPSPPPTPPSPRRAATAGGIDKGEETSLPPPKHRAPPPPPPAVEKDSLVDPAVLLEAHNAARMLTGAANLTWSSSLAKSAQDWIGGAYSTPTDLTRGVDMWVGEVCNYDFSKPGWGMDTGHWTQVVWRNTRQLGCGYRVCRNGVKGMGNYAATSTELGVLVCHYSPPGNFMGAQPFRDNVHPASPMPSCAGKRR
ncbi:Cell wall protein PRY3 [Tetrabaena socialis]|uniref:Cell wall protein PRY3 n=1 Tax=Tetrabaena socialis TaxID=47790 RepID=A0A2J8AK79_9CHLO|nr:Cell wall protein PRY3 [Tetrabaena socialis]|eukprot:PNH12922.1 Cell wall protein PRY3 [Tetrabaena socialis]